MTSRDFCYWLQGFFEISESPDISRQQTAIIKRHLAMVFKHEIDPSMGDDVKQYLLDKIHDEKSPFHVKPPAARC